MADRITISLIKRFKENIQNEDWGKFYSNLYGVRHGIIPGPDINGTNIGEVTQVLYEAGLIGAILTSMDHIPPLMFMDTKINMNITIPSNILWVEHEAFEKSSFKKILFNEGCISIGSECFYGCHNLDGISLPESLNEIEERAFLFCTNLTKIRIPPNVTSVGRQCFEHCDSLKEIEVPITLKDLITKNRFDENKRVVPPTVKIIYYS